VAVFIECKDTNSFAGNGSDEAPAKQDVSRRVRTPDRPKVYGRDERGKLIHVGWEDHTGRLHLTKEGERLLAL
jgi:hypothetical protein